MWIELRYLVLVASLGAFSSAAQAQEEAASPWEFFVEEGGRSGALVKAENGSQIVFKCDKPGQREVHAIILSPADRLAVPTPRPISRPITFQFDGGSPRKENWGFFEHHAIAQGRTSDRALARFVNGLKGTSSVKMRLDTGISREVVLDFETAGAQEAIARVYETCRDRMPS